MIWNPDIECRDDADIKKQQLRDLVDLVGRVYKNVPFYKKKIRRCRGAAGGYHESRGYSKAALHDER